MGLIVIGPTPRHMVGRNGLLQGRGLNRGATRCGGMSSGQGE
jgi:hypothetical protein